MGRLYRGGSFIAEFMVNENMLSYLQKASSMYKTFGAKLTPCFRLRVKCAKQSEFPNFMVAR